ncbi:hypothetical protein J3R83DRAFT_8090 [Lanmaoa asiatica]|nr:hypothetical protein J3R83DRAFT_8090 [Lanmaoa asiatica]
MPQLDVVHADRIGDERNYQEKVVSSGCGSRFARNESLPEHQRTCRAKGEAVTATGEVRERSCLPEFVSLGIQDKDVQVVLTTNSPKGYNQDWSPLVCFYFFILRSLGLNVPSPKDMIAFNGHLIDEMEVICQWVDHGIFCNDPVKGKDLKVHLCLRHGVIFDSRLCTCLWHGCISRPMKKSNLGRHMEEQHNPVRWACPTCDKTFTRKGSLMDHFERPCPGRV